MSNRVIIFRWSGEYFGFIDNGYLFDSHSNYLGWAESDGSVWNEDGTYLGEMVEDSYILRNITMYEPIARIPKIPPISPIPPIPPFNRYGNYAMYGWQDALDRFSE